MSLFCYIQTFQKTKGREHYNKAEKECTCVSSSKMSELEWILNGLRREKKKRAKNHKKLIQLIIRK